MDAGTPEPILSLGKVLILRRGCPLSYTLSHGEYAGSKQLEKVVA
jgi:hypothetical protein